MILFGLHNQSIIQRIYKKIKKIRDYIKNYIKINIRISSGVEGIAGIKIKKRIDLIQVIISMGFPKLLIEGKPGRIEELQMNLQKKTQLCEPKTEHCYYKNCKPLWTS
ncbi:hypothetical protein AHAS_AhasUnG0101000 [Arachis hypogaea]